MLRTLAITCALMIGTGALADDTTMIVLDASGSMWGQIDGVNKISIAREVVRESLGNASLDQSVGLVAYGHNRKGDCSDIEVLVPPAVGHISTVVSAVEGITPKGKTPLTEAVRQAATTMRHEENRATIVLVTDGLETCGADPCALARELEQSGLDFTAHVVGFGLSKEDGAAVACLANETGGRYFKADNRGELASALSLAVVQDIRQETKIEEPPQVEPKYNLQINVQLSPDSPPLEEGEIDKLSLNLIAQPGGTSKNIGYSPVLAHKADPGMYVLRAKYEGGEVDLPVTLERFETTHANVVLDAGVADFHAIPLSPDLIDPAIISWEVTNVETGRKIGRYKPELRSVFLAGTYEIRAILGRKAASAPDPVVVEIAAGDIVEGEILLPHGALGIETLSDNGSNLPTSFTRFGLWTAKEDGGPDRFVVGLNDTKNALLALPGDYVLVAEDWGIAGGGKRKLARPITIEPGNMINLRITMPSDVAVPMSELP